VNPTERYWFWTLLAAALAYVFAQAWLGEVSSPRVMPALGLLLALGVAAFSWWRPGRGVAAAGRPIFLLAAGGFTLYVLVPWVFRILWRLFPQRSLIWRVPGMDYFAEALWYAVPLVLVILLFRISAPGDWKERFFLRLNWYLHDTGILAAFLLLTVIGLWLYLSYFTPSEGWNPLGSRRGGPLAFVIFGVFSAAANAAVEEFWYRGYFLGLLARLLEPRMAITLTALLFGLIHLHGIPSGWLGVGMAAVYGVALACWTWVRGSIWQAVALHFLTDVVIFFGVN